MRQLLANLARKIFGPSSAENLLGTMHDLTLQSCIRSQKEVDIRGAEIIRLMGILYRPNEKIEAIRQPLLDGILLSQGEPIIINEEFTGLGPPDISKVKAKIELALSCCQKAIKEQTRGVEPEAEDGSEAT